MKWGPLLVLFAGLLLLAHTVVALHVSDIILDISLPSRYENVEADETVIVESQIILLGDGQTVADVLIDYEIRDRSDALITKTTETKGGLLRIQTVKELQIPKQTHPGVYEIIVTASHGDVQKQSSVMFEVKEKEEIGNAETRNVFILMAILLVNIIFFIILFYEMHKFKKIENLFERVSEKDLKRFVG